MKYMILKRQLLLIVLLLVTSIIIAGCNRSEPGPNEYPKTRAQPTALPGPTATPLGGGGTVETKATPSGPLTVGDVGQAGNISVKLNSVKQDADQVLINVTVQNRGTIEANINPAFYFQVQNQDGSPASFMNFGTPDPRLPSSVPVGGQVTGNMSFQGVTGLKGAKLIFDPKQGTPITWVLEKD